MSYMLMAQDKCLPRENTICIQQYIRLLACHVVLSLDYVEAYYPVNTVNPLLKCFSLPVGDGPQTAMFLIANNIFKKLLT